MEQAIKGKVFESVVPRATKLFREHGFKGLGLAAMEAMRVEPKFVREADPLLKEDRHRLNTEPGLIIANHPGSYDAFTILSVLERNDVKIVVAKKVFEKMSPIIGQEPLISVDDKGVASLRKLFHEVEAHIESGGVVILFPSGGNDHRDGFKFEQGFGRMMLPALRPTDMVYAFQFDALQMQMARQGRLMSKHLDIASAFVLPNLTKRIHQLPGLSAKPFEVNERYTEAAEWQQIPAKDVVAMTDHFKSLFPGARFDKL